MKVRCTTAAEVTSLIEAWQAAGISPVSKVSLDFTSLAEMDQPNAFLFLRFVDELPFVLTTKEGEESVLLAADTQTEAFLIVDVLAQYLTGVSALDLRRPE